jgi:hypothetical protein
MTRRQLARRYLWALLIAGILAVTFSRLNAAADDIPIQTPDICRYLEPWAYWWGFFGCEGHVQ